MEHLSTLTISEGKLETVVEQIRNSAQVQTVIIEDEVNLTFVLLDLSAHEPTSATYNFILGNGSQLRLLSIAMGPDSQHTIQSICKGQNAMSTITCLSYAKGDERHHITATNVFEAPNGGGEILMKAVAENKAQIKLNGKIEIGLKGTGTNTYLTQNVLMLDTTAKIDAVPSLEIKTNDVKASHSASVSRLTAEDLFTFAARGIDEEEARRMYILGFLKDAISGLPEEERILEAIERKYGQVM